MLILCMDIYLYPCLKSCEYQEKLVYWVILQIKVVLKKVFLQVIIHVIY